MAFSSCVGSSTQNGCGVVVGAADVEVTVGEYNLHYSNKNYITVISQVSMNKSMHPVKTLSNSNYILWYAVWITNHEYCLD